jgi:hypothetical protein
MQTYRTIKKLQFYFLNEKYPMWNTKFPPYESADGGFHTLCKSLFGRPNLRGDADWPTTSFGLSLILSDLALIQRPWWKICRHAGLFFFREHILVNSLKTRYSLGDEQGSFFESLLKEGYKQIEVSSNLQSVLARILGPRDVVEDWQLLEIPINERDSVALLELLALTKCPSIASFDGNDVTTENQIEEEGTILTVVTETIMDNPPIENRQDWIESRRNPGEYYRNMIDPKMMGEEPLAWVFRLPQTKSTQLFL